jgi:hypothetical protein
MNWRIEILWGQARWLTCNDVNYDASCPDCQKKLMQTFAELLLRDCVYSVHALDGPFSIAGVLKEYGIKDK